MRDISTYPVSFPYGATSPPYSPSHPHSGDDRAAPKGTPIIVSGVEIGVVGSSGKATGTHLHIQKAVSNQYVNPGGGGLNITGTVSEVGYNTEIGNYVRIMDNGGVRWSYFHMDRPATVTIGQLIGGNDVSTVGEVEFNYLFFNFFGDKVQPTEGDRKRWIGGETNTVIRQMEDDPRRGSYDQYVKDLEKAVQSGGQAPVPPTATKLTKGLYEV